MALFEILTIAAVGGMIHKGIKNKREREAEEKRRKMSNALIKGLKKTYRAAKKEKRESIPCSFDDGISQQQLSEITRKAGKHIKRLKKLYVDGPIVYGTVRTQSGTSEWNFTIDFNDYGHITGRYWIHTDNYDSKIPEYVADTISLMIQELLEDL